MRMGIFSNSDPDARVTMIAKNELKWEQVSYMIASAEEEDRTMSRTRPERIASKKRDMGTQSPSNNDRHIVLCFTGLHSHFNVPLGLAVFCNGGKFVGSGRHFGELELSVVIRVLPQGLLERSPF